VQHRASIGKRLFSCACVALFLGTLAWREASLLPDGRLRVKFLDVGQGDAALILTPSGRRILIDGGPDWRALSHLGDALPFFDRRIDVLVLTHPHLDHLASFPEVLKRYPVGTVLMAGTPYALGRYQAMLELMQEKGVPAIGPEAGVIRVESGVTLTVLWPPPGTFGASVKNVNTASVTAMLEYRGTRVLFAGDMEEDVERELLLRGTDVRADVLKVAHHGSRGSSTAAFLRAVGASVAVISSGSGNTFGHPRPEALRRLSDAGMEIRRTDLEGTVEFAW
jgi:competence protein ComEC